MALPAIKSPPVREFKARAGVRSEREKRSRKLASFSDDFETTTDPLDCRVWLWGSVPVDNSLAPMDWGTDIESYISFVGRVASIRYFHNLKHDGAFILDYLMKRGFTYHAGDKRDMPPNTFSTLISDSGKWYSFVVKWDNGTKTEFRDSLKKINMSVARIAQAFNFADDEGLEKGDIDYHAYRPVGYQPTEAELDYQQRDVSIVAAALKQVLDSGMVRLTTASDSLAEYKRLFGTQNFDATFPVLAPEIDAEIRRAYRGGFTYADDRFSKKRQGAGIVLDVNSLYPSVMYNDVLPYGEPERFDGGPQPTKSKPLCIFGVTFTARIKPKHIPIIQLKGSSRFVGTEYLKVIDEPVTLMVTDVDWKMYNEHYDIDVIAMHGGWRFAGVVGLFKEYIDKWSKIKAESTGGKKEIAKLHLNSLYGKFATNPNITGKYPTLENDLVKLKRGPEEFKDPVYTAVGVFVTAYARALTIRAAQRNYDVFAYADTDSLHLLTDTIPAEIDVDPVRMGAWKFEYAFKEALYVRAKAYLESTYDPCPEGCAAEHKHTAPYHVAWAGLPEKIQSTLTFDNVWDGRVITEGKLQPKTVPGGVVLIDVPYKLNLTA